ncbi:D-alanyl-D-alanine carboxypeptidase family protein [Alkalicella caledoniensis]|nr:D-alanyl-D-alanine carboxypeptidase family protein [Alkalicella caledoniensis]
MFKKISVLFIVFIYLSSGSVFAYDARSYILMDRQTKQILLAHNAQEKLEMASTTKIMTALVAIELADLESEFTIPDEAAGIEGSSIYLSAGETFKVIDLLYGLMIRSGNDSAVALAIATAGSEAHFVHLMNQKAEMIGAYNTVFANPHGLDGAIHYTTAYDLALITAHAMDNPLLKEIASTKYYKSTTKQGTVREFHSNNKFILNYPYATTSKTGWTTPAGRCLTSAAKKDEMEIVSVLLNAPNWFNDAMHMMDWGFENFEAVELVAKDAVLDIVDVVNGDKRVVPVVAGESLNFPVKKGSDPIITTEKQIHNTYAPISKGEKLGVLQFYIDGKIFYEVDLLASEDVAKKPLPWYLRLISKLNFIGNIPLESKGWYSW